jgi:Domain of unknown function (DUF6438)
MKKLILIAFLACLSCSKKEVLPPETAKERAEVEEFIHKTDTLYKDFKLHLPDYFADSRHLYSMRDSIIKEFLAHNGINRTFYYADFDGNGIDDILAMGDNPSVCGGLQPGEPCMFCCLVVLKYPESKSKVIKLQRGWRGLFVPQVVKQNGKPLIHIFEPAQYIINTQIIPVRRYTLGYVNSEFIEYNPEPADNKIEKIEFYTDGCFGTCPMYQLTLNKTGTSYFIARHYNFSDEIGKDYNKEEGFFKCHINKNDYVSLEKLLNYINAEKLNKYYQVLGTDQPTGFLKITYNNGKTKKVGDYGKVGTYGLMQLYNLMDEIRFNQKWEKTTEKQGVRMSLEEEYER